MVEPKFYRLFKLFSYQGNFEILDYLSKNNKPIRYSELKTIKNLVRGNYLSSKTIVRRLKELEQEDIIKKELVDPKRSSAVGYKITDFGSKAIDVFKETESKLEVLSNKK